MRRALAIDEQSFGTEHPNVAIRLNNLALLLKATNRLSEAEPMMRRALRIDEEEAQAKFGFLLGALQAGAPPHGGMAAGVDRIVMLLCGAQNLREITLFPMNQKAEDLLMGAPSKPEPKQLRELHLRVVEPPKEQN